MTQYWCNRVVQVGSHFPDINVVMGHSISFSSQRGMRNGEIGGHSWDTSKPHVVILDNQNQKFIMRDNFSVENFDKFLNDFNHGKIKPFIAHDDL